MKKELLLSITLIICAIIISLSFIYIQKLKSDSVIKMEIKQPTGMFKYSK